jgi:hypothetical protein
MTSVTFPTGMKLIDWADCVAFDVGTIGTVGRLMNELGWKDWASQFLNLPGIGRTIPDPKQFDDWQEWAFRFCQAIA